MREELKVIVAFVEGSLDAKGFERQLYANYVRFKEVLNDDPDLPLGYLEQGVYLFVIQQNFDHFADVLNVHGTLQNYLARNGIPSDATGAYSKFFSLLLEAQPNWIQGRDWPIIEDRPLVFLGQVEVESYFHDDAAAYVFYDAASCACETILQVA